MDEKDVRDAVRNKNIPPVVVNEDFAYMATACPSYPYDLIDKVQHGQDSSGNAFILVMTPCPTGWMFAPDKTLEIGRQAVLTGYFPLFEVDGGKIQLTVQPKNRKPKTSTPSDKRGDGRKPQNRKPKTAAPGDKN